MLGIMFVVLALISIACVIRGAVNNRKNIGFLIMSAMIAVGDIFYLALVNVDNAKSVSNVLLPYYILHAWFMFAFLLMLIQVDHYKRFSIFLIIPGIMCLYQTYLVISQYFGARVFSFQKRIYFGHSFWVAVDSKNTGLLFSFRSYRIVTYINLALILITLIICIVYSHKIYKMRYHVFLIMIVAYMTAEALTVYLALPVWIAGVLHTLLSLSCLYFTDVYAKNRLQQWSLNHFANDMSDGLILYDKYNDLILLNEMVKDTLEDKLLEDFSDRNKLEEWIENSRDTEYDGVITYTGIDRDYYFKVSTKEFGVNAQHIGSLFILHDTTDSIIRIKTMKEANDELERASHMKSDFLANMSHEIRTPMNAVIGMAEIAMREKDPQVIMEYLVQIQNSGRNLVNIINDILDYSKIESGKMEIIEENYRPFDELSDIANVLGTRIGEKNLELFVLVENGLAHELYGDAMRIRQVLINLANNAIKFTKEGMVRIHVSSEPVSEGIVNMTYHVIDTGIGIKPEDIKKLFVSFQQVDSKRNRTVEGTGLGLAISQRLVEAMNGKIGVNSEYGKGSDFWFTIPQKVIDETDDLQVENADGKFAYVLDDYEEMMKVFTDEMQRFGLDSKGIFNLDEYTPTGKREFLFFKEERYDTDIQEFLDKHPDVMGIIMIGLTSEFGPDKENLHTLRRPESTMTMANILNERYNKKRQIDSEKLFQPDFTAPQARILVVDDNPINLTIAAGLMAPLKVQMDTVDGGREAVDLVMQNAYDIVYMDHMMPEIDGIDAAKMIRMAKDSIHQPVIIALSANVMEDARKLFAEAGMEDFVAKPIDIKELTVSVRKWLPKDKIIENQESDEVETANEEMVTVKCKELDIDVAVRSLGSVALYNKISEEFYRTGDERLEGIRNAYASEDWRDYTIKVHALKSSSRQIGAMQLGDMAETLENAGKSGDIDTLRASTGDTLQVLRKLLDELAIYYPEEEDSSEKPLINPDTLAGFLEELHNCCELLELDGMEEIGNQMKQYSYEEALQEPISVLYKAIADIDTDTCEEMIEQLRAIGLNN